MRLPSTAWRGNVSAVVIQRGAPVMNNFKYRIVDPDLRKTR